ncbi:MAG: thiamine diphosphokinase [Mangrovicoccus sp.]
MSETLLKSDRPVTLIGAGALDPAQLHLAQSFAPQLVAADGGARSALAAGQVPDLVIGDFDSLDQATQSQIPADHLHRIEDQDSTDFHKCLSRIAAPLVLAVGFTGGRMDHLLAVYNVLPRLADRPCIIIGPEDFGFLCPPQLELDLEPGTTVSLFPMGPCRVESTGLHWPTSGLDFAPNGQSGTSNRATGPITLQTAHSDILVFLPISVIGPLIAALIAAPNWPNAKK